MIRLFREALRGDDKLVATTGPEMFAPWSSSTTANNRPPIGLRLKGEDSHDFVLACDDEGARWLIEGLQWGLAHRAGETVKDKV